MNILVFFGGKSAEHDISIITGCQALSNMDETAFRVYPIYIDGEGVWYHGKGLESIESYKPFRKTRYKKVCVHPSDNALYTLKGKRILKKIDCAVLCMHGKNGEDGTLQGVLEMSGIPYTSSNTTSSALCMDKALTKLALQGLGLPVLPSITILNGTDFDDIKKRLENNVLSYPLIVKPCNLGSSIGITKADNDEALKTALTVAFEFDSRVLLEKCLTSFSEYNCSCLLGAASGVEEPMKREEVLSFSDKYLNGGNAKSGNQKGGMASLERRIEADITEELREQIRELSETIYRELCCYGVIRTDFIFDNETKKLYINEINTIPGSMSFYLWSEQGIRFHKLLKKLIDAAIKRKTETDKQKYQYISPVLGDFKGTKQ